MTYLQFHLVFILPPLLAVALWSRPWARGRRVLLSILALPVIALVYTTPWDNYLVWRGVWGYGTERVLATIGYVPIEEYMFFVLQPLLTGMFLLRLLDGAPGADASPGERADANADASPASTPPATGSSTRVRAIGALVYAAIAAVGVVSLQAETTTYMGLILAWAAPVLAAMWGWAGAEIWRRRRAVSWGIAIPTLWLWLADAVAIRLGIWEIYDRFTIGIEPFGLPIEEATFFLMTNILVAQGLVLFLYPPGGVGVGGGNDPVVGGGDDPGVGGVEDPAVRGGHP